MDQQQPQSPPQYEPFTDDELRELRDSGEDLSSLTTEEQGRMKALPDFKTGNAVTPEGKNVVTRGDDWTDYLPSVGATAASMLGGTKATPVGMALAGLGGAAGEASKQVIDVLRGNMDEVPSSPFQQLKKIGTEGLTQAGYEGVGRGIGAAVQPLARRIYLKALKPTDAIKRNVGGKNTIEGARRLAQQGLDDAILPATEGGATRAGQLASRSKLAARNVAKQQPGTIPMSDITQKVGQDQVDRMATEAMDLGARPNFQPVREQMQELASFNKPDVSAERLLDIRNTAGKKSAPMFRAMRQPMSGVTSVPLGSEASVNKSLADVAKGTLDDWLGPAFQKANKTTINRKNLEEAVRAASQRPAGGNLLPAVAGMGLGFGTGDVTTALSAAALTKLLSSPNTYGATAIGLSKAPYAALFRGADASGLSPDVRALFPPDEEE